MRHIITASSKVLAAGLGCLTLFICAALLPGQAPASNNGTGFNATASGGCAGRAFAPERVGTYLRFGGQQTCPTNIASNAQGCLATASNVLLYCAPVQKRAAVPQPAGSPVKWSPVPVAGYKYPCTPIRTLQPYRTFVRGNWAPFTFVTRGEDYSNVVWAYLKCRRG